MLPIAVLAVVFVLLINFLYSSYASSRMEEIKYNEFQQMLENDEIAEVEIQSDRILIQTKEQKDLPETEQKILFTGLVGDTELISSLSAHGVEFYHEIQNEMSPLFQILLSYVIPFAAIYLLFSFLMRNIGGKMGGGMSIGQSKAKVFMEKETGVTFADVAGQDEAKESLQEIIDFLHNPQKYAAIGAKIPKGALLVGSPGTGKTLLAKAVAGEAGVPFFFISGSDFVEMFVGVGASRVRDLFQQAAKQAPAIIFIDEIDAIGKSRDNRLGSNDEREQTLNQLLSEIDGFDSSKGVVILAATNRPEILDKALLRAGRFDRRIIVDKPNLAGRLQTLKVHTKNIKLTEDVDLNRIAQVTAGAVGADLANLVNEAALRAVRMGRHAVNQEDLLVSFEVVIAGTEKKGTVLTDTEKRIVSYHEVGHALVAALQKHTAPVQKITIVPHTSGALGYTLQMEEEEKFLNSKEELISELKTLLAGRAAEEVVFGVQTTGAANDIEKATDLARRMIMQFGMSDRFGLMALVTAQSQYLGGQNAMNCAESTAAAADEEVRDLLQKCYEAAKQMLRENRETLDEIALFLLTKETITGDEFMAFLKKPEELPEAVEASVPDEESASESPAFEASEPDTEEI
ncbi:MAG: ATP-dependent zinc metalloprotease FtsH [Oscillospiraceae bacterium]|nr:ATP-dependent zinc metalloprotease FtsH [Oscillospiraceae bacterium]